MQGGAQIKYRGQEAEGERLRIAEVLAPAASAVQAEKWRNHGPRGVQQKDSPALSYCSK